MNVVMGAVMGSMEIPCGMNSLLFQCSVDSDSTVPFSMSCRSLEAVMQLA